MVTVTLVRGGGVMRGFRVKGHAGFAASGTDIVCAAVSSAAYLTANTVTDVLGIDAKPTVSDSRMELMLTKPQAELAQTTLQGFALHMRELAKTFPQNIRVIYGGVHHDEN
ncbi:hypothetical protein SDC9_206105 [bioreactor metagenome]|uniref:Ribosomal-processing cysteine protease Prp n=1 Tax=bioreactor metagenome TaxID=1076179 RepID=A0A645J5I4_9ZZZZ